MSDWILTDRPSAEQLQNEISRDARLQSPHTRRAYLADLLAFEAWRQGRPTSRLIVEEYAAHLQAERRSPNSINRALAALRWLARRRADLAHEAPLAPERRDEILSQSGRVAGVHDVTGARLPRGRHIAPDELTALLQACGRDHTPAGARDGALFSVAWSTGLRRSELRALGMGDRSETAGRVQLQVRGKGNKVRVVYLHRNAQAILQAWLKVRGPASGPIFCPIRKGSKIAAGRGLSAEGLALILTRRAIQGGLEKSLNWHDFRRTFAGNLLDEGVDLVTVQKLLGHSSPVTTSSYDRRGETARQRAIEKLPMPDVL